MFTFTSKPFGKFTKIVITEQDSGTGFSLVPEYGATLLDLRFKGVNFLDGYTTAGQLEGQKWSKSAILFPFPNRLRDGKYHWLGQDYSFELNNKSTSNAIHGIVKTASFKVKTVTLSAKHAAVTCSYAYKGVHPGYPFPCTLQVTFSIFKNKRFEVAFSVKNKGEGPIPVGLGWHPYFKLAETSDECQLRLPFSNRVEVDERMLPTGNLQELSAEERKCALSNGKSLDTCFQVTSNPEKGERKYNKIYNVETKSDKYGLNMSVLSHDFPYYQIFTPPHRKSIAIEPMTCNVDAFNNHLGLRVLEPGEKLFTNFAFDFKFKKTKKEKEQKKEKKMAALTK